MKLYLSPSNQPKNRYVVGDTSEKEQMEILAKLVQKKLSLFDLDTMMANFNLYIYKNERPTEAQKAGCSFYFALHSNAGGAGKARGPVAFYDPLSPLSMEFAQNLIEELNAVTPYGENRDRQVVSGMTAIQGKPMAEVRYPRELGMDALLLEVDFHDNPVTARYILDNKDVIADAIVKAAARTFKLELKTVIPPVKPSVPVKEEIIDDNYDYTGIGTATIVYDGTDGVNARRSPDYGNNIDHVVRKGEVFTVVRKVNRFYQLKSGLFLTNHPKYVEFKEKPVHLVRVTVDTLNIRKGPAVTTEDVGNVYKGDVFTIVGTSGPWGKLKSGVGWIHLGFTEKV